MKDSEIYKRGLSKTGMDLMVKIDEMTNNELKICLHNILKRDREWREAFLKDDISLIKNG